MSYIKLFYEKNINMNDYVRIARRSAILILGNAWKIQTTAESLECDVRVTNKH